MKRMILPAVACAAALTLSACSEEIRDTARPETPASTSEALTRAVNASDAVANTRANADLAASAARDAAALPVPGSADDKAANAAQLAASNVAAAADKAASAAVTAGENAVQAASAAADKQ